MKKQALTLAIAAALSAPSALAAQDTSGMRFTSASEGFYASIRARYESGASEEAKGKIENSSSRIGVRGSNDLGGGMEGFYQWELGVNTDNGSSAGNVRVGRVGLRGAFGQVQFGSFWAASNDYVTGVTDVANVGSGNFAGETGYRVKNAVEYVTPDLNGFQGAVRLAAEGGGKDGNNVDHWNIAAKYSTHGFTVGALYHNDADGLEATDMVITNLGTGNAIGGAGAQADTVVAAKKKDDRRAWRVGLHYGQDNWYAAGWYGAREDRNVKPHVDAAQDVAGAFSDEDETVMSLAGGVSIDKINLYALWEKKDGNNEGQDSQEQTYTTLGAQYNLGSNTRVWLEYDMRDLDTDKLTATGANNTDRADDSFNIGLQHDF